MIGRRPGDLCVACKKRWRQKNGEKKCGICYRQAHGLVKQRYIPGVGHPWRRADSALLAEKAAKS